MNTSVSVSRRKFLMGGGATLMWIPSGTKGYTGHEIRKMESDGGLGIGVSKWELDTPALLVDLDKLDLNIRSMQRVVTKNGIASRPHAKTHKCPEIAKLQLATGSVGICVAKLSEAEVMFSHDIEEILLTTSNVTAQKILRAMALRKSCKGFIQAVDTIQNVEDLAEAAREAGIVADVVVDVDSSSHRTGITPGKPALELAQIVDKSSSLRLRGILCYDGGSQHMHGFSKRREQTLGRLTAASETARMMDRSGLTTEIFSGGGTGTYNIDHEIAGFTDVQAGSYIFMDAQYLAIGGANNDEIYSDFQPSLTIMTTVLNAQYSGRATTDAGAKSCTINKPWPIVSGETGMSYTAGSDEFGTIRYENASRVYDVGDKLELIVSHCDPVVNLYDQIYGIRNDKVEKVWSIAARGSSI